MKIFKSWYDVPKNFTGICKTLDNTIRYCKNGKPHREDGPAIIFEDGAKYWYLNGLQHRESGPAIMYSNGAKGFFYKHKRYVAYNKFTNTLWLEKIKKLKREEELKIFV